MRRPAILSGGLYEHTQRDRNVRKNTNVKRQPGFYETNLPVGGFFLCGVAAYLLRNNHDQIYHFVGSLPPIKMAGEFAMNHMDFGHALTNISSYVKELNSNYPQVAQAITTTKFALSGMIAGKLIGKRLDKKVGEEIANARSIMEQVRNTSDLPFDR